MPKVFHALLIPIALLGGLSLPAAALTPAKPKLSEAQLKNLAYHPLLAEEPAPLVKLVKGQHQFKEGGFLELEKIAWGDLNGDGYEDAVVQLVENGGGTGYFRHLQIVLNQKGKPVLSAVNEPLGDRIVIKLMAVQKGLIVLDVITHGDNDGACCPTQPATLRYKLQGQALVAK